MKKLVAVLFLHKDACYRTSPMVASEIGILVKFQQKKQINKYKKIGIN